MKWYQPGKFRNLHTVEHKKTSLKKGCFLSTEDIVRCVESIDTLIQSTGLVRCGELLEARRADS